MGSMMKELRGGGNAPPRIFGLEPALRGEQTQISGLQDVTVTYGLGPRT